MRAALYARKSTTDSRNPGKSVADQLREARAEAENRGWTVVAALHDDGISASRFANGKSRPGFDQLLALVETGDIQAIVMAEQSRATRSLAVLGSLLEASADRGVLLVLGGTDVDPSRPEGFLMAGVVGSVDAAESERIRQRTLRGARGGAVAGKPHGRNLYGYTRRYDPQTRALLAVEPSEAAPVVVEVIDRLLAGESVRAVTSDLNERGVPTPTGKGSWHPVAVRRLAMNPGYAGLRVHRGEVVGKAAWPALVPEDRHRAVVARLTAPTRGTFKPGGTKHLLSGTARCGECGGPLRVVLDRRRRTYTCFTAGCFKVGTGYDHLNEYVTEAVVARLERPDVAEAIAATSGEDYTAARDTLEALQARRVEVGKAMAAGLDPVAAQVALEAIAGDIAKAEAAMRAAVSDPLLASMAGAGARARWEALNDEQRAALVRMVVRPVLERSTRPRGSHGFDADRVRLEWLA